MELAKGLSVDLVGGDVILKYKLAELVIPALDSVAAKFQSGAIDLIKGTDIDKEAALKLIAAIKAEISK